jgi:hypothetical protein
MGLSCGNFAEESGHSTQRYPLMGQTEKNSVRAHVFCFALELGHCSTQSACLKRAIAQQPTFEMKEAPTEAALLQGDKADH